MDLVKKELEDKSLLQESQGAYGVDLGESRFSRILTPDGRSLYLTRDIAAAIYDSNPNFDSSLYVVGAPQSLHFKQLIQILKSLGYSFAENIKHVEFGHVLGMKTRGEGEIVELNDFLNEAYELALKAYREQVTKRPEAWMNKNSKFCFACGNYVQHPKQDQT